jgi:hypothetical protein
LKTRLAAYASQQLARLDRASTSRLRGLDLPKNVRDLIVLAEGDEASEGAATDGASLTERARLPRVHIGRPPRRLDFGDLLDGRPSRLGESGS